MYVYECTCVCSVVIVFAEYKNAAYMHTCVDTTLLMPTTYMYICMYVYIYACVSIHVSAYCLFMYFMYIIHCVVYYHTFYESAFMHKWKLYWYFGHNTKILPMSQI